MKGDVAPFSAEELHARSARELLEAAGCAEERPGLYALRRGPFSLRTTLSDEGVLDSLDVWLRCGWVSGVGHELDRWSYPGITADGEVAGLIDRDVRAALLALARGAIRVRVRGRWVTLRVPSATRWYDVRWPARARYRSGPPQLSPTGDGFIDVRELGDTLPRATV